MNISATFGTHCAVSYTHLDVYKRQVQAAALRGTVTDKATKEPLIGAAVQLSGTNTVTITDVDGNFELAGLRNGTYKLIICLLYTSRCV